MHLEKLSATEIGKLVNTKVLKPTEVITYFYDRISSIDPSINAFTYTKIDEAMSVAKDQEKKLAAGQKLGPLAGVPVGLKDFLPTKKGWTHSYGYRR